VYIISAKIKPLCSVGVICFKSAVFVFKIIIPVKQNFNKSYVTTWMQK